MGKKLRPQESRTSTEAADALGKPRDVRRSGDRRSATLSQDRVGRDRKFSSPLRVRQVASLSQGWPVKQFGDAGAFEDAHDCGPGREYKLQTSPTDYAGGEPTPLASPFAMTPLLLFLSWRRAGTPSEAIVRAGRPKRSFPPSTSKRRVASRRSANARPLFVPLHCASRFSLVWPLPQETRLAWYVAHGQPAARLS